MGMLMGILYMYFYGVLDGDFNWGFCMGIL